MKNKNSVSGTGLQAYAARTYCLSGSIVMQDQPDYPGPDYPGKVIARLSAGTPVPYALLADTLADLGGSGIAIVCGHLLGLNATSTDWCLLAMDLTNYSLRTEPFYYPTSNETAIFQAAAASRLPIMLKGPTGCGKTRFVEHMAWQLGRPLITVACHEDMTAADLAGRYLLNAEGTVWTDGPLTTAVRYGAICYLDEVVEAQQDTTVVIHPLADNRRVLPLVRKGELVTAHPDFLLVVSYNPGYQSAVKDLKESTKQRFVAINFTYPPADAEAAIVAREAGIDYRLSRDLVSVANSTRNLRGRGLGEGASTRMIVHAGRLMAAGIPRADALRASVVLPLTDDLDMREALEAVIAACSA